MGLWSVIAGIKNEYLGWHRFRQATGMWPLYSVLAGIFSIPVLFAFGAYLWLKAFETSQFPHIYAGLCVIVICDAAVWYGLRRVACKVDVARAQERSGNLFSSAALETLIR